MSALRAIDPEDLRQELFPNRSTRKRGERREKKVEGHGICEICGDQGETVRDVHAECLDIEKYMQETMPK